MSSCSSTSSSSSSSSSSCSSFSSPPINNNVTTINHHHLNYQNIENLLGYNLNNLPPTSLVTNQQQFLAYAQAHAQQFSNNPYNNSSTTAAFCSAPIGSGDIFKPSGCHNTSGVNYASSSSNINAIATTNSATKQHHHREIDEMDGDDDGEFGNNETSTKLKLVNKYAKKIDELNESSLKKAATMSKSSKAKKNKRSTTTAMSKKSRPKMSGGSGGDCGGCSGNCSDLACC
jgi:hypothetical protein